MQKANPIILFTLLIVSIHNISGQGFTSDLPIIHITTSAPIEDAEKVNGRMTIINRSSSGLNSSLDTTYVLNEKIGIEFRGSSSQTFPKKGYGLEVRNEEGEDKDVSIFTWPEESDYVLFASYNEKSFLHNVLTMILANQMGMYAPRTRYVELVINGSYEGLYVLMEKIKRDKGRLDIAKLDPDENTGDDLTGGYILKIDKFTGSVDYVFQSKYKSYRGKNIYYQLDTPKEPSQEQKQYIKTYVDAFEDRFYTSFYTDPVLGYRPMMDVPSFVKYFIISEVARNMDAYRISSFMYKDKDSKDPRLKMGPIWDFDIAYGNADYCEGNRSDLWAYKFNDICPNDEFQVPYWWEKLVLDPYFIREVRQEYSLQRSEGVLSPGFLHASIDSLAQEISVAQAHNFQKWPILGTYVWPQPNPIANSWQQEVNELRSWLDRRLKWLDAQWLIPTPVHNLASSDVILSPNPSLNLSAVNIQGLPVDEYQFDLFSSSMNLVIRSPKIHVARDQNLGEAFTNVDNLLPDFYIVKAQGTKNVYYLRLIVP